LSRLRAPLGVWGCNGNHEIYAGVEDEAERLFREKGMRLLRAQSEVIEHNGARFNLLGVDYQRDHMTSNSAERTGPMLQEIEHLIRRDMPNILLSHNPNSFHRAAELAICGGTLSPANSSFSSSSSSGSKDWRRRVREQRIAEGRALCESRPRDIWISGADWRASGDHAADAAQSMRVEPRKPMVTPPARAQTWYNSPVKPPRYAPVNAGT